MLCKSRTLLALGMSGLSSLLLPTFFLLSSSSLFFTASRPFSPNVRMNHFSISRLLLLFTAWLVFSVSSFAWLVMFSGSPSILGIAEFMVPTGSFFHAQIRVSFHIIEELSPNVRMILFSTVKNRFVNIPRKIDKCQRNYPNRILK